ncbi:MAG: S9 family peptidase [Gemmatimonadetes bacterium]|nr:S9 family peptidase [Gemmatimonadota bacterium]MYG22490.1 S9 family peptidase [Gemmatimonadota bacterium]MYJ39661.1 S9 family peptidase [Gemmatimonadota bacterium]
MRRMDTPTSGLAAYRPSSAKRSLPRPALPLAALVLTAALACQYEAPAAGDAAGAAVSAASSSAADPISAAELVDLTAAVGGTHPPRWSPDGSRITFVSGGDLGSVSTEDGAFEILTEDLSLSGVGSLGAPQPTWSPDGRWIAYTSDKGGAPDIWLWSAVEGDGMRASVDVQLTELSARANGLAWSPDGSRIAFSGDRFGNMDIWTVSVPDGKVSRLTDDPLYEGYPSWTPDGERLLYVRMDDRWVDHDVIEVDPDGKNPRTVVQDRGFFDYRAGRAFASAQVSPDGETVLFRSQSSGWLNFWVVPRDGSAEPRQIAASDYDQSDARWSPDGSWISYTENRDGIHSLRLVSADGSKSKVLVDPEVGAALRAEWSPDGGSISYTMETPTRPAELFVMDIESGESRLLHSTVAEGSPEKLHMPEKVAFPSSDGLTIPAYLHRPPDAEPGERFPGVMWIHGGPTSQFDDQFRRHQQVHFFAQRGYVVLMPNIRGSSGYGLEFEDLNNGCWGHCDLEDVLAGVDYLKTLPDVDPDRIAVTGTSYGGIMTMDAVAFAPGVFQAAIALSGYGDMTDFHTKVHELQHIKLLEYELGPYPENRDVYLNSSAILKAHEVTTPTFVIQGEGVAADWRLREDQPQASLDFARKLDQHYKIVRYKAYPGEGYYVYGRDNTIQKLHDMLVFFEEFLVTEIGGM